LKIENGKLKMIVSTFA